MYYPILRGKQNELLALRELKDNLGISKKIIPIIEPVKESVANLNTCITSLNDSGAEHIILCNPNVGYFKENKRQLLEYTGSILPSSPLTSLAYWIHGGTTLSEIQDFVRNAGTNRFYFLHRSHYPNIEELNSLTRLANFSGHLFLSEATSESYRTQFSEQKRSLIKDNFGRQEKNEDYVALPDEFYSDQYVTFIRDGYYGFSDFSVIGDSYSESGGPAFTVAIHLTYERSEEIWIRHFTSSTNKIDPDVALMIIEALEDLVNFVNSSNYSSIETSAINEFKAIYTEGKRTTLGYIKKLAIKHHFELMMDVL